MQEAPIIRLEGISKYFGPVRANHNISLDIKNHSILALLGENGAGKSTLMAILAGKSQQDTGKIFIDGKECRLHSPKDALAAGIGMVYQHFMLIDAMTVTENVVLGQEHGLLHPKKIQEKVEKLAQQYSLDINPTAKISSLSMGERQRVEILKLLYRDCRVLILDEPTAVLTPPEIEQLFNSLRHMANQGKALVFISHKMQEVLDLAQEIAILRRGEVVDLFARSAVPDQRELASRMIGRNLSPPIAPQPAEIGEIVLETQALGGDVIKEISLCLRRGEVLAIVGVAGNGQKELVEVLAGLQSPKQGKVRILDSTWKDFYSGRISDSQSLVYIPEDRKGLATCPSLSLADNFLLTNRFRFLKSFFMRYILAWSHTSKVMENYHVVAGNADSIAGSLSGGNLQKFVLGREFDRAPRLIIAENPTQGLDIAATEEVWRRVLEMRLQAGVLLITSDLTEALALADSFAVMYRGRFMALFPRADAEKIKNIGLLMAGISLPPIEE